MQLSVLPSKALIGTYGVSSTLGIPGDKSISHRAALLAGMATGESHIENFMVSGVTRVLLEALAMLGVEYRLEADTLNIQSPGYQAWKTPESPLYCGNSATTMRLLAGAIAAAGIPAVIDGSESLRHRPMTRIIDPLNAMGVPIQGQAGGFAPLAIEKHRRPSNTQPFEYSLPVASAQVKTCLLLAGLSGSGEIILHEPEISRDHTERMLLGMGQHIEETFNSGHSIHLVPINNKELPPLKYRIPGDFSSAAFLIVAGLITPESHFQLRGIGLNKTRTGLLDVLQSMGANIYTINQAKLHEEPVGDLMIQSSKLHGTTVNGSLVVRMIDEFPALAATAIFASGTTQVQDAEELHYKETDRIISLCDELTKIGAVVTPLPGGFNIKGQNMIQGGTVDTHRDHRLAMSLAVAGLASRIGVTINEAEIIRESYPGFIRILENAGANLRLAEN